MSEDKKTKNNISPTALGLTNSTGTINAAAKGSSYKDDYFLRRYTELPYLIDYLSTGELFLPSPKTWDDRNDSYYLEQYAKIENLNDTYALCLTEAAETYHHWKVFSSGSSGVCIVFNKEKLIEIANKNSELQIRPVKYKTIKEMREYNIPKNDLPFLKRYPYRDECEYRLFATPSKEVKGGGYRFVVPKTTILQISLSPWLPKSVVGHVKSLLKSIRGCSGIKIYGSTLVENEEWKKFSGKVT